MKLNKTLAIGALMSMMVCSGVQAESRTWTSSDGAKTFKGEVTKYEGDKVTVRMLGGKSVTFTTDKLSEADVKWLEENKESIGAPPAPVVKENSTTFGKEVLGKLKALKGDAFAPKEVKSTAKYFVLYFSASWCGPCRQGAPHSVEVYNSKVAGSKTVDVIHCSCDQAEANALDWAKKENFPWPTILQAQFTPLIKAQMPRGIPTAVLVDAEGNKISSGSMEACVDAALKQK